MTVACRYMKWNSDNSIPCTRFVIFLVFVVSVVVFTVLFFGKCWIFHPVFIPFFSVHKGCFLFFFSLVFFFFLIFFFLRQCQTFSSKKSVCRSQLQIRQSVNATETFQCQCLHVHPTANTVYTIIYKNIIAW